MKKINWKFWNLGIHFVLVLIYIFLFRLLYPPLYVWWTVPALVKKKVPGVSTSSNAPWYIWAFVGVAVLFLLLQNRKRIEGWWAARQAARRAQAAAGGGGAPATAGAPTPSVWPIVAKWVFGVLGGLAIAYGLYLIPYAQVWGWLQRLPYGNIPLWGYTVGIPVLILIIAVLIAALKDGKTGSEKLKKLADLFGAFAKLGLTLALIAVLTIFIVGPRMFWRGNYTPPPAPVGGTQAAPAVPATPVPQSRTITIPVGDLNAPLNQWSEEVRVVPGWNFRCELRPMGRMGVLVDGTQKVISEPGRDTPTHATKSLRFVSLTGAPLQMRVDYFR